MANPGILIIGLRETHDTSLPDARTSDSSSRSGDKKKNLKFTFYNRYTILAD